MTQKNDEEELVYEGKMTLHRIIDWGLLILLIVVVIYAHYHNAYCPTCTCLENTPHMLIP